MSIANRTMIAALAVTAALGAAIAGHAKGESRTCTTAPRAEWKSIADVERSIAGSGYEIDRSEMKRACYEIHARKDGQRYELYVDPVTATIVRSETR